jgi:hypothetical protein
VVAPAKIAVSVPVPLDGLLKRLKTPFRLELKYMVSASGDQAGYKSPPGSKVNRVGNDVSPS